MTNKDIRRVLAGTSKIALFELTNGLVLLADTELDVVHPVQTAASVLSHMPYETFYLEKDIPTPVKDEALNLVLNADISIPDISANKSERLRELNDYFIKEVSERN